MKLIIREIFVLLLCFFISQPLVLADEDCLAPFSHIPNSQKDILLHILKKSFKTAAANKSLEEDQSLFFDKASLFLEENSADTVKTISAIVNQYFASQPHLADNFFFDEAFVSPSGDFLIPMTDPKTQKTAFLRVYLENDNVLIKELTAFPFKKELMETNKTEITRIYAQDDKIIFMDTQLVDNANQEDAEEIKMFHETYRPQIFTDQISFSNKFEKLIVDLPAGRDLWFANLDIDLCYRLDKIWGRRIGEKIVSEMQNIIFDIFANYQDYHDVYSRGEETKILFVDKAEQNIAEVVEKIRRETKLRLKRKYRVISLTSLKDIDDSVKRNEIVKVLETEAGMFVSEYAGTYLGLFTVGFGEYDYSLHIEKNMRKVQEIIKDKGYSDVLTWENNEFNNGQLWAPTISIGVVSKDEFLKASDEGLQNYNRGKTKQLFKMMDEYSEMSLAKAKERRDDTFIGISFFKDNAPYDAGKLLKKERLEQIDRIKSNRHLSVYEENQRDDFDYRFMSENYFQKYLAEQDVSQKDYTLVEAEIVWQGGLVDEFKSGLSSQQLLSLRGNKDGVGLKGLNMMFGHGGADILISDILLSFYATLEKEFGDGNNDIPVTSRYIDRTITLIPSKDAAYDRLMAFADKFEQHLNASFDLDIKAVVKIAAVRSQDSLNSRDLLNKLEKTSLTASFPGANSERMTSSRGNVFAVYQKGVEADIAPIQKMKAEESWVELYNHKQFSAMDRYAIEVGADIWSHSLGQGEITAVSADGFLCDFQNQRQVEITADNYDDVFLWLPISGTDSELISVDEFLNRSGETLEERFAKWDKEDQENALIQLCEEILLQYPVKDIDKSSITSLKGGSVSDPVRVKGVDSDGKRFDWIIKPEPQKNNLKAKWEHDQVENLAKEFRNSDHESIVSRLIPQYGGDVLVNYRGKNYIVYEYKAGMQINKADVDDSILQEVGRTIARMRISDKKNIGTDNPGYMGENIELWRDEYLDYRNDILFSDISAEDKDEAVAEIDFMLGELDLLSRNLKKYNYFKQRKRFVHGDISPGNTHFKIRPSGRLELSALFDLGNARIDCVGAELVIALMHFAGNWRDYKSLTNADSITLLKSYMQETGFWNKRSLTKDEILTIPEALRAANIEYDLRLRRNEFKNGGRAFAIRKKEFAALDNIDWEKGFASLFADIDKRKISNELDSRYLFMKNLYSDLLSLQSDKQSLKAEEITNAVYTEFLKHKDSLMAASRDASVWEYFMEQVNRALWVLNDKESEGKELTYMYRRQKPYMLSYDAGGGIYEVMDLETKQTVSASDKEIASLISSEKISDRSSEYPVLLPLYFGGSGDILRWIHQVKGIREKHPNQFLSAVLFENMPSNELLLPELTGNNKLVDEIIWLKHPEGSFVGDNFHPYFASAPSLNRMAWEAVLKHLIKEQGIKKVYNFILRSQTGENVEWVNSDSWWVNPFTGEVASYLDNSESVAVALSGAEKAFSVKWWKSQNISADDIVVGMNIRLSQNHNVDTNSLPDEFMATVGIIKNLVADNKRNVKFLVFGDSFTTYMKFLKNKLASLNPDEFAEKNKIEAMLAEYEKAVAVMQTNKNIIDFTEVWLQKEGDTVYSLREQMAIFNRLNLVVGPNSGIFDLAFTSAEKGVGIRMQANRDNHHNAYLADKDKKMIDVLQTQRNKVIKTGDEKSLWMRKGNNLTALKNALKKAFVSLKNTDEKAYITQREYTISMQNLEYTFLSDAIINPQLVDQFEALTEGLAFWGIQAGGDSENLGFVLQNVESNDNRALSVYYGLSYHLSFSSDNENYVLITGVNEEIDLIPPTSQQYLKYLRSAAVIFVWNEKQKDLLVNDYGVDAAHIEFVGNEERKKNADNYLMLEVQQQKLITGDRAHWTAMSISKKIADVCYKLYDLSEVQHNLQEQNKQIKERKFFNTDYITPDFSLRELVRMANKYAEGSKSINTKEFFDLVAKNHLPVTIHTNYGKVITKNHFFRKLSRQFA